MNSPNWYKLIGLAGVLLIIAAAVHGGFVASGREAKSISVTGSAKRRVDADLAKWTTQFVNRAELTNVKEVLARSNGDTEKIRRFIVNQGLEDATITFLPIQTDPVYSIEPGYGKAQQIVGYDVRQEVRVESRDIEKIEKLAKQASQLVDQGIVPQYQRTEYFYTKLAELRPELFAEATKDAKDRAEAIARGTGVSVGKLRSARTGVIQVMSPNSIDVSDYGTYDLSTKEKEVTATVSVSFELR